MFASCNMIHSVLQQWVIGYGVFDWIGNIISRVKKGQMHQAYVSSTHL
jgi:hypothetical protein